MNKGGIKGKVCKTAFDEMTSPVILQLNTADTEIIVRQNGYVLYARIFNEKKRRTIFHLHKMYLNEYSRFNKTSDFNGSTCPEFLELDAVQAIRICGEMRFINNNSKRWEKMMESSLDSQGSHYEKATDTVTRLQPDTYWDLSTPMIDRDDATERHLAIENAIAKLTVVQQSVIRGTIYAGLSCNELARRTGKNPKTVSECKRNALKRLHELLKDIENNL